MLPARDLVLGFFESEDPFPIDFDDAWRWIGYAKKQNAKDKLVRNFERDIDYTLTQMRESAPQGGLTHRETIQLTVDCFKSLAMMAGTEKGKEVRRYFLDCEKDLKRRIAEDERVHKGRILEAYVSKDKLPWEKKFENEFYYQIHRLKGWNYDPNASKRTPLIGKITNDIVYARLQPGVLQELQRKNPVLPSGRRQYRHHQFLTDNIGNPHLRSHLSKLIMLMHGCSKWAAFIALLDRFMPRAYHIQSDILFELLESGHIDFDEWEKLVS